jgi:hypothetical protein
MWGQKLDPLDENPQEHDSSKVAKTLDYALIWEIYWGN